MTACLWFFTSSGSGSSSSSSEDMSMSVAVCCCRSNSYTSIDPNDIQVHAALSTRPKRM